MPAIPVLGKLRKEEAKFKASVAYIARLTGVLTKRRNLFTDRGRGRISYKQRQR
jgi:hypothetical protein